MRYLIVLPLVLLLAVVWQACAEDSSADASRKAVKEAENEEGCITCCKEVKAMPPCHCLQELLYDYPGPYDLYYCFTHANNCTEAVGELWYGKPINPYYPQVCHWNQCEPYMGYKEGDAERVPGHGSDLEASVAWNITEAALEAAKLKNLDLKWYDAEFHTIASKDIALPHGMKSDIVIMAVPIELPVPPTKPEDTSDDSDSAADKESDDAQNKQETKKYYVCMQIDSLGEEDETSATLNSSKPGTGRQYFINYKVGNDVRDGVLWMKN